MPVNSTTHIVSAYEVNLVLHVEVNYSNHTIVAEKTVDRINGGVKLRDHGKCVAHGHELSTTGVGVLIEIAYCLALGYDLLALIRFRLMFVETECTCILADNLDVGPTKTCESFAGHFAKAW